jgi:hypothetical protein
MFGSPGRTSKGTLPQRANHGHVSQIQAAALHAVSVSVTDFKHNWILAKVQPVESRCSIGETDGQDNAKCRFPNGLKNETPPLESPRISETSVPPACKIKEQNS